MAATATKYSVGDKVVHPQHGAATIQKKVRQAFGGKKQDYKGRKGRPYPKGNFHERNPPAESMSAGGLSRLEGRVTGV